MTNTIGLLVTGSEITEGRILDTNSHWLSNYLSRFGFYVGEIVAVDDQENMIIHALNHLLSGYDSVIISGGLGPTDDDLTREAVAALLNVPVIESTEAMGFVEQAYVRRQRQMSPSNRKQGTLPQGASVIFNPLGTAPGFSVKFNHKVMIALPGVPWELKAMIQQDSVLELLGSGTLKESKLEQKIIRIIGLPESVVGERIKAASIDTRIKVAYRAAFPEVHVLLRGTAGEILDASFEKAKSALGIEHIFSCSEDLSLESVVSGSLLQSGLTISVAESCSGGRLAAALTRFPDASKFFIGGAVSYANSAKEDVLKVPKQLLEKYGAVSAEVAESMATGARACFKSDLAVSITGIAGPSGGSAEKPVGLFFIGFSSEKETSHQRFLVPLEREQIQQYSTAMALDKIRRYICSL